MKKRILLLFIYIITAIFIINPVFAFMIPSSDDIYNGIDVSTWQGDIDFEKVKNDGIDIVYIRVSEGASYTDSHFKDNYYGAKENNLKVGFYHFLTAKNIDEAKEQAEFFVNTINKTNPDCKLAMDFEIFDGLSNDEINNISEVFLKTVENLSGKECVIYSDAYNAKEVFSKELAKKYAIWIADYFVEEPESNNKWASWVGFQYSDIGRINGIKGNVDRDKFTNGILLNNKSEITYESSNDINKSIQYITVKYGETLSQIAERYNTSYQYLAKINNISNPNLIYVGQKIEVEKFTSNILHDTNHILYTVKRGNTLTGIAKRYNVLIDSIVKLNDISNPNFIYTGEILRIPV